jgi:spore coat protein A, manganese oxidase
MTTTRRQFLQVSAMAGAGLIFAKRAAHAFVNSTGLRKFVQPLAGLGPTGIPVATPNTAIYPGIDYYRLAMGEFEQTLHPDLPPTRLWGYADVTDGGPPNHRHLGGVVVAQSGRPVRISFINDLPTTHPLPVDTSIPGAEPDQPENRAVVHLHGGHVPWTSDGGPFAWSTPGNALRGASRIDWLPDNTGLLTDDVYYPNDQSARLMWYHDHAIGITRLNAYAGLASGYLVRDGFEQALIDAGAVPGLVPGSEIPLVIQDKIFIPPSGNPEPGGRGRHGDLWYPSVYDPEMFALEPSPLPLPVPSVVAEFFGDTMLVNGLVFPFVTVEQRKYRFRILNACNSRFCNLQIFYARGPAFPDNSEPALNNRGPAFKQIGTEGGFLPSSVKPVLLQAVLLAPAERADVIVDFSEVPVGSYLILYNDAPGPFPDGAHDTDYFVGARRNPVVTQPGFGPNTRTLMQFRVMPRVGPKDPKPTAPLKLPPIARLSPVGARVRNLTLNEAFDQYGRLAQLLGTDAMTGPGTFGRLYMDPVTEDPVAGTVEVWNIFNLSADTHPIHFHLVNVQVLGRQRFKVRAFTGEPQFTGTFRPPDPNETGWKETVRMNPGEMTRVIMYFDNPPAPVAVPPSPRTGGNEYVWHCHILEHEEHDMMRPLVVD